jgi:hypothetical protein
MHTPMRVDLSCNGQNIHGSHGSCDGYHSSVRRLFFSLPLYHGIYSHNRLAVIVSEHVHNQRISHHRTVYVCPSRLKYTLLTTLWAITEPVLAGLERTPSGGLKPYIAGADLIGCLNLPRILSWQGLRRISCLVLQRGYGNQILARKTFLRQ